MTKHVGEKHFAAVEGDERHFHLDTFDPWQAFFGAVEDVLFITLGIDFQEDLVSRPDILIEDAIQFPDRYFFFGYVLSFRGVFDVGWIEIEAPDLALRARENLGVGFAMNSYKCLRRQQKITPLRLVRWEIDREGD